MLKFIIGTKIQSRNTDVTNAQGSCAGSSLMVLNVSTVDYDWSNLNGAEV